MSDADRMDRSGGDQELLPKLFEGLSADQHKDATTVLFRLDATQVIQVRQPEAMELWRKIVGTAEGAEEDALGPIRETSLPAKLKPDGRPRNRFNDPQKIGEGGCAVVYKVREANLNRDIALKILKDDEKPAAADVDRFITEASVVAGLEHPGIIPVYELDADADGRVYMCMQRVQGITLKDYIDETHAGHVCEPIRTQGELIQVFQKVCDAMAYAHSKGTVHQDLKPANIMIGDYGEVFVIDWGASATADDELALTPVYMSPQQALCLPAVATDDVYCLGATLFHCLVGRFPTDATTLKELVRKKQSGEIDPLTDQERARVPAPLLSIALKAIAPQPEDRYQSMEEFADDLQKYQEGLAVSAHNESLRHFLKRWARRHRHGLLSAAAIGLTAAVLIAGFSWRFHRLKARELESWKENHVETFATADGYLENWAITRGEFTVEDGELVSRKGYPFYLTYKHRLYGSHALEYTGEVTPGTRLGDLSLVWYENDPFGTDPERISKGKYILQVGGWYNSFSLINSTHNAVLAYHPFRLQHGRRYRIRGEVDGHYLRVYVDGRKLCEYRREFPFSSGWFGLYLYYAGKRIDDVRIFSKGGAELVTATRIGDSYYQQDLYDRAMHEYDIVMNTARNQHLREEARYKRALCLLQLGRKEEAFGHFRALTDSSVDALVRKHLLLQSYDRGEHRQTAADMAQLYAAGDDQHRAEIHRLWERFVTGLRRRGRWRNQQPYLELRRTHFPDDPMHRFTLAAVLTEYGRNAAVASWSDAKPPYAVFALHSLRRYEESVERYPNVRRLNVKGLISLGREKEARRRFPETWQNDAHYLLYEHGKFDAVLKEFPKSDGAARARLAMGRYEEVLAIHADRPNPCALALLALGRYEDILARYPNDDEAAEALLCLGQYEEVLKTYPSFGEADTARRWLGRFDEAKPTDAPGKPSAALLLFRGRSDLLIDGGYSDRDRHAGLLAMGRFKQILKDYHFAPNLTGPALLAMGRAKDIKLEQYGKHLWTRARLDLGRHQDIVDMPDLGRYAACEALYHEDRYDKILRSFRDCSAFVTYVLLRQGKHRQARLAAGGNFSWLLTCKQYAALDQAAAGDLDGALKRLDAVTDEMVGWSGHGWDHYILPAFIRVLAGDQDALRRRLAPIIAERRYVMAQTLWHDAALMLGRIDEKTFRQQPRQQRLEARLRLTQGMKAELEGNKQEALRAYSLWEALPTWKRPADPVPGRFVEWRQNALQ